MAEISAILWQVIFVSGQLCTGLILWLFQLRNDHWNGESEPSFYYSHSLKELFSLARILWQHSPGRSLQVWSDSQRKKKLKELGWCSEWVHSISCASHLCHTLLPVYPPCEEKNERLFEDSSLSIHKFTNCVFIKSIFIEFQPNFRQFPRLQSSDSTWSANEDRDTFWSWERKWYN